MSLDDILKDTKISIDVMIDIIEHRPDIKACLAESMRAYAENETFLSIAKFREAMRLMEAYASGKKLVGTTLR